LATEIHTVVNHNRDNVESVMTMLAVTTTGLGLHKNAMWPFYCVPSYEQRTSEVRKLTKSKLVMFTPIVSTEQRELWDDYSHANTFWIDDGLKFENKTADEQFITDDDARTITIPSLHSSHQDPFGNVLSSDVVGPFAPTWQLSELPTNFSLINYDLFQNDIFRKVEQYVASNRIVGVSEVFDLRTLFGSGVDQENLTPQSFLLQPLFQNFSKTSNIVGYFVLVLKWMSYFENILQDGRNGIVCVIRNTCSQAYTFEIAGAQGN
jgi:hypothetical protein